MAALDLPAPVIIGNSIGGAVAIRHAARHPVRGLVLCDSGGLVPVDRTVQRFCALFEAFFAANIQAMPANIGEKRSCRRATAARSRAMAENRGFPHKSE